MADLTTALGCDLDIGQRDMALSSYNDLQLVAGLARASQAIYVRAITEPGTLLFHPEYGMGLGGLVAEPLSSTRRSEIVDLVARQVALEPWCASVAEVDLDLDPVTHILTLIVSFVPVGGFDVMTVQIPLTPPGH